MFARGVKPYPNPLRGKAASQLNKNIMADIGIKISNNPKRESVFINHKVKPRDIEEKIYDDNGNVIGVNVKKVDNIVATGINRRDAVRKGIYGK